MIRTLTAQLRGRWMGALALFPVIAGGTAYAANTVGSDDIIDGQVKSADIGNNQVQSVDVRDQAIASSDLAVGSVANDEIRVGAIPDHLEDPIIVSSGSNTTTAKEVLVPCEFGGDNVTGGGFVISGPGGSNVPNVAIQRNYAVDDHTWLVRAVVTSGTPEWQLTGIATCAF